MFGSTPSKRLMKNKSKPLNASRPICLRGRCSEINQMQLPNPVNQNLKGDLLCVFISVLSLSVPYVLIHVKHTES